MTIHWKAVEQYFTVVLCFSILPSLDLALSEVKGLTHQGEKFQTGQWQIHKDHVHGGYLGRPKNKDHKERVISNNPVVCNETNYFSRVSLAAFLEYCQESVPGKKIGGQQIVNELGRWIGQQSLSG